MFFAMITGLLFGAGSISLGLFHNQSEPMFWIARSVIVIGVFTAIMSSPWSDRGIFKIFFGGFCIGLGFTQILFHLVPLYTEIIRNGPKIMARGISVTGWMSNLIFICLGIVGY